MRLVIINCSLTAAFSCLVDILCFRSSNAIDRPRRMHLNSCTRDNLHITWGMGERRSLAAQGGDQIAWVSMAKRRDRGIKEAKAMGEGLVVAVMWMCNCIVERYTFHPPGEGIALAKGLIHGEHRYQGNALHCPLHPTKAPAIISKITQMHAASYVTIAWKQFILCCLSGTHKLCTIFPLIYDGIYVRLSVAVLRKGFYFLYGRPLCSLYHSPIILTHWASK